MDGASADKDLLARICQDMVSWENEGQSTRSRFEKILDDDFWFRNQNGKSINKRDFIGALAGNAQANEQWVKGSIEIHLLGAVAVAMLLVGLAPRGRRTTERHNEVDFFLNLKVFFRNENNEDWKLKIWINIKVPVSP